MTNRINPYNSAYFPNSLYYRPYTHYGRHEYYSTYREPYNLFTNEHYRRGRWSEFVPIRVPYLEYEVRS